MKKRNVLFWGLLLLGIVLLGCSSNGVPSEPSESSEPITLTVSSTVPLETEISPPTELPYEMDQLYNELLDTQFEHVYGDLHYYAKDDRRRSYPPVFRYAGTSETIHLASLGITLTLPESWVGRVDIIQKCGSTNGMGRAYISCRALNEAYMEYEKQELGYTYDTVEAVMEASVWDVFILSLRSYKKEDYQEYGIDRYGEDPRDPNYMIYLGENEEYYIYAEIPEILNPEWNNCLVIRDHVIINNLGKETYDALVGDLVATPEMIREMVKIDDQIVFHDQ